MEEGGAFGRQAIVLHLDELIAREVREHLIASGAGYRSLNEFVEVALMNQLAAEAAGAAHNTLLGSDASEIPALAPVNGPPPELADPVTADEALFVLTNRLGPVKVAARALANMGVGGWPTLRKFQQTAARSARELGLRLRQQDAAEGRGGGARRWVAFPVGADERAAVDRFIFSFTLEAGAEGASGAMAVLGLARLNGDRVMLTERGWALAAETSPLIDGSTAGPRLSSAESKILREQVRRAPREFEAVDEFVGLVTRAAGSQPRLDEQLAARHQDWTAVLALAHRSAMLGRLADLGALEVSGRGPKATIQLLPPAQELRITEEVAE